MKATKSSRLSLFSVFAFCLARKDQPLSFPLSTTTVIFGLWSIFQYAKVKSTTLIPFITLLFLSLPLSNQSKDENGKKKRVIKSEYESIFQVVASLYVHMSLHVIY